MRHPQNPSTTRVCRTLCPGSSPWRTRFRSAILVSLATTLPEGFPMRSLIARTGVAAVLGVASSVVVAHHSFAMFDQTKQVTVIGTVTEVQWTNPHVWVFLD